MADGAGASPAQVALAWLRNHDQVVGPIAGARPVDQSTENFGAPDVSLLDDQPDRLAAAKPGSVTDIADSPARSDR